MEEYFVEEKSAVDKLLDFLVFVAVFVVTIFLILELVAESADLNLARINAIYFYVNIVVFIIFFLDLVRLWKQSTGAKDFFAHNWLDVLATIPFGLMAQSMVTFEILKLARISRLVKLQRISRVSKISKEFKAASHLKKESEEYQKKHRL